MNEKVTDKARGMFEKATGYVSSSSSFWGGGGGYSCFCDWEGRDGMGFDGVILVLMLTGYGRKHVPEKFSN